MREIVLDTETTGLDPSAGDRIVEIGAVELFNHMPTSKNYHCYINPQRDIPTEAFNVHGLSSEFLSDKPLFADIVDDFLTFIGDSKLIIHNARFDMKFINAELQEASRTTLPWARAIDTLDIARRKFPGAQNSLDALCRRFGVNNSAREKHGALLDSELLGEVYLELVGGRQPDFALAVVKEDKTKKLSKDWVPPIRERMLTPRITTQETKAHDEFIEEFAEDALWKNY